MGRRVHTEDNSVTLPDDSLCPQVRSHPTEAEEIAATAAAHVENTLSSRALAVYTAALIKRYAALYNGNDQATELRHGGIAVLRLRCSDYCILLLFCVHQLPYRIEHLIEHEPVRALAYILVRAQSV